MLFPSIFLLLSLMVIFAISASPSVYVPFAESDDAVMLVALIEGDRDWVEKSF